MGKAATASFKIKRIDATNNTAIRQTEDGTILFWQFTVPNRLYVKKHGKEIDAKLPHPQINPSAHGNAIYFTCKDKIYSAIFFPSVGIKIFPLRAKLKGESFHEQGLCSREIDGKKYVYRMYDNPDTDIIPVNLSNEQLQNMELRAVHRGKAIYISKTTFTFIPTVRAIAENAIAIETIVPGRWWPDISARDSSPFIYFAPQMQKEIHTLDMDAMEFMPAITLEEVDMIWYVSGIYNGMVNAHVIISDVSYLVMKPLSNENIKSLNSSGNENCEFESEFLKKFIPRRILGQGAFGCVFEARNLMDGLLYAVKRIPLRGSDKDIRDALKEVRTLASLKHDGIVGYNSSWLEKPPPGGKIDAHILERLGHYEMPIDKKNCAFVYIQMELCKQTLHEYLQATSERDIPLAKTWFKQLVSAVSYIHENGKIHRDMKTSNILLDKNSRLKICNLGFAANRALRNGQEIDETRTVIRTPMYMAPEQVFGKYTSKVDIFSLGLILVELCVYLTRDEASQVFMKYRQGKPITSLIKQSDASKLISKMTKVDAAKRPSCEKILKHSFLT